MTEAFRIDPELGAAMLGEADGADLARLLLAAARRVDAVEEVYAALVPQTGPPSALCSSGSGCDSGACARNYARSFYRFDPVLQALTQAPVRTGVARQVRAADIQMRDYRTQCFDRPRYADKLSFGWRGATHTLLLSFYRRRAEPDDGALDRLGGVAQLGLSTLTHRLKREEHARATSLVDRLQARLRYRFPVLTPREVEVCARTLAGETSEQAGAAMGIAAVSVLTYRRRAYARLGFSRAGEFLDRLIV